MTKLMIYGAAGYTGRMASANAQAHGLDLIVAGRPMAQSGGRHPRQRCLHSRGNRADLVSNSSRSVEINLDKYSSEA